MGSLYYVFWVGGERDGEVLGLYEDKRSAIRAAQRLEFEHDGEFDAVWGGIAIEDKDGNTVEW